MIRGTVRADADRHDHRHEFARQQQIDEAGIDALDFADEAQVGRIALEGFAPRMDEAAVLAVESDGAAAMFVDQPRQFLIQFSKRHLDDGKRTLVGDAHTPMPVVFDAHLLRQLVDAPAAAVDDDRLHADRAQECHVASEARLEHRIGHCLAAEANDQRLAMIRADIWQRFGENAAFVDAGHGQTCMLSVFDAACGASMSTSRSTS